VDVRLGISDGKSTELLGGELAEGSEVIIGVAEPRAARKTTQANPLQALLF
jgi:hypothetical protein